MGIVIDNRLGDRNLNKELNRRPRGCHILVFMRKYLFVRGFYDNK